MGRKTKHLKARLLSPERTEELRKFLLEHEYDIYSGFYNFANLRNLFKELFEREAIEFPEEVKSE